jgi:hypothetical protein
MGQLIRRSSILLVAAVLLPLSAYADDLLVMPYGCRVVGGRPLLTPAPNQSHRIMGAREQRVFRTCSPMNPTLCRQWTIHRFDMDCDGVPSSWASVIANAYPERTWLENGRLHIRMPPSWNMAADDPCSAGPDRGEGWRYGRLQRYCADRRALAPAAFVELPAGFAPMFGTDAIFVTPSPAKSAGQLAAHSSQPPVVSAAPASSPNLTRTEPPPTAAPKPTLPEAPPSKQPAANAEVLAVAPTAAPIAPRIINRPDAVTAPALPVREPTAAPKPTLPEAPPSKQPPANAEVVAVAPPAAPIVPRIINRPDAVAETAPALPVREPRLETSALTPPPAARPAAATPAAATPAPALSPETPAAMTSFLAVARGAVIVLASVLGAFAAVALTLARVRQRQLGASQAPPSEGRGRRQQVVVPRPQQVAATSAVRSTTPAVSPAWSEEVPRTRSDALRVLGMGVTADANLSAIKKIVDGLRQTWHPDLARDPAEREARERRMKQINVAWDILAPKPARS